MRYVVLMALALAGCVTADTEMLDDRTAVISGRGTAFDNSAGVLKKILVSAAQTAQARGYEYFQVVSSQDATRVGVYVPPTSSTTNLSGHCTGNWCSGSANTTAWGGGMVPMVKPGADVMIRLLRSGEVDPSAPGVFSVAAVLAEAK